MARSATTLNAKAVASGPEPVDSGKLDFSDIFPNRRLDRKRGPLYRQVAETIRGAMSAGRLQPGYSLPREIDLAQMFGVSLITVRQALRDLETEGLIRKRSAKPTIVSHPSPKRSTSFDFNSIAAIAASAEGRRIEIIDYRRRKSGRASEVFGLPSGEQVHCLRAILSLGSDPVTQSTVYFAPSVGSRLTRDDFDDVVIFRSVQRHLGIRLRGAHVNVRAEIADAALAEQLDCGEGDPILAVEIIYFDENGQPVELTINRNRADRFSLQLDAPNNEG